MPKPRSHHRKVPDQQAKAVGDRIRKLRKTKGISFDAFVEETGLGRGHVSEVERGMVSPNISTLSAVAKALELTVTDLVIGDSPRENLFKLTADLSSEDVARLLDQADAARSRGTKTE